MNASSAFFSADRDLSDLGAALGAARSLSPRDRALERYLVTAAQMQAIEGRVFAAGMPVAALMEKVAGLLVRRFCDRYPLAGGAEVPAVSGERPTPRPVRRVGVLVGPGHNGGDALVMARELHLRGYSVAVCQPLEKAKDLTRQHARYLAGLGVPIARTVEPLLAAEVAIDGLFGFGLERPIAGDLAAIVDGLNASGRPVFAIDLPSGVQTDTGEILGTAVRATETACLGLWKRGLLEDRALDFVGRASLVDFGLPLADVEAVLLPGSEGAGGGAEEAAGSREAPGDEDGPPIAFRLAATTAPWLPPRSADTHKYRQGHLLLVAGSRQFCGAVLLAGLGARASGVGMLSIAVPESLQFLVAGRLPEALVLPCPETAAGAIAGFPDGFDPDRYDAIAAGCGLTPGVEGIVRQLWGRDCPLVLDADGLNVLARLGAIGAIARRGAPTVLTPHPGEFSRLFPVLGAVMARDRLRAARQAARQAGAVVVLKGARAIVADPDGALWVNAESTPALARGGSGDVLTGLLGGILAGVFAAAGRGEERPERSPAGLPYVRTATEAAALATWWHAAAGRRAAAARSVLGADGAALAEALLAVARDRDRSAFDLS